MPEPAWEASVLDSNLCKDFPDTPTHIRQVKKVLPTARPVMRAASPEPWRFATFSNLTRSPGRARFQWCIVLVCRRGPRYSSGMRTGFFLVTFAAVFTAAAALAQTPPSADNVLAKARARAADEHKTVFVLFDASW